MGQEAIDPTLLEAMAAQTRAEEDLVRHVRGTPGYKGRGTAPCPRCRMVEGRRWPWHAGDCILDEACAEAAALGAALLRADGVFDEARQRNGCYLPPLVAYPRWRVAASGEIR